MSERARLIETKENARPTARRTPLVLEKKESLTVAPPPLERRESLIAQLMRPSASPTLERNESVIVQVARVGASGGISGIMSRGFQWMTDAVSSPPKSDNKRRVAVRRRWRKVIRAVIAGVRLGRGVADEHVEEEAEDSDDENEQLSSLSHRFKLGVLRIADASANIVVNAIVEYPSQFLSMGVILAEEVAGTPAWPGSTKMLMVLGMGVYRGFLPWAAGFFIRKIASKTPTVIETLTGNPLSKWANRAVRVVSAAAAIVPVVVCEQLWVRQLLSCRKVVETVDRTGLYGVPWWAVGLRGVNEAFGQNVDAVTMWHYYLPSSHPLAERRSLQESIRATPVFVPRFLVMPLILFPLPDFKWNVKSWWPRSSAVMCGYTYGFFVSLPLRAAFAAVRHRVLGRTLEDVDAHLERKLAHAQSHEAKVRGKVDTTPVVPQLLRQPTVELKTAAAVGLQAKIDALRRRIANFADKNVSDGSRAEVEVDRSQLLASLTDISRQPATALVRGAFRVKFKGEQGLDAGGLMRDYLHEIGQTLSHCPRLLSPGPDSALLPTKQDPSQPEWKRELFAVGRLMAVAITASAPLDICLSSCVYKVLLGERITLSDVSRLDPQFAELRIANLLKPGGVAALEEMLCDHLTFVGVPGEEELIDGGKNVRVTEHNKQQYVRLLVEHYLVGRCRSELAVLVEGFHDVIPKSVLKTSPPLRALDLELMVAGLPGIDVADWRANCEGNLMTKEENKDLREWFWAHVTSMNVETRAKVLSFACGSARVPGGGFANLKPKFNVAVEGSVDHLPSAHTCMNQLVLPRYHTQAQLGTMLNKALEYNTGFGFI